jgi:Zn-dependent protease
MFTLTQKIIAWILPVLFAITLHEAAHAFIANRCGDSTAKSLGRVSLNPLRHIDLIGTILVPIAMAVLSKFHFIFGWAKPVPINWQLLRHPRRDTALVAIAGPAANLLMCFMWAACFKVATLFHPESSSIAAFLLLSGQAGVFINLVLGLLNLLPIPPLDGSRIVASLLPPKYAYYYLKVERFGFLILIVLLVSGVLGWLIRPLLLVSFSIIKLIFGL